MIQQTSFADRLLKTYFLAMFLITVIGCGTNVRNVANRSIEISYHTLKSAESTYHRINESAQLEIVETSKTLSEAKDKTSAYREKAKKIYKAFTIAYTAIGAASTAIAFSDIGKLDEHELIVLILDAKTAVEQVIELIKQE